MVEASAKLAALSKLGRYVGMWGDYRIEPPEIDLEVAGAAMLVLAWPWSKWDQRVACSMILDYYLPEWRELARPEVIGRIVDRGSTEVAHWRKAVFDRDGRMCTRCGSPDQLEAHHVLHWATHPDARLILDNGLTLCERCHKAEHGRLH